MERMHQNWEQLPRASTANLPFLAVTIKHIDTHDLEQFYTHSTLATVRNDAANSRAWRSRELLRSTIVTRFRCSSFDQRLRGTISELEKNICVRSYELNQSYLSQEWLANFARNCPLERRKSAGKKHEWLYRNNHTTSATLNQKPPFFSASSEENYYYLTSLMHMQRLHQRRTLNMPVIRYRRFAVWLHHRKINLKTNTN